MCEFDREYLKKMEERLNRSMEIVLSKTASTVVNPATQTALNGLRDEFLTEVKTITKMLNEIYPHVMSEIEHKQAYALVRKDISTGTGFMKWALLTIVTFGALTGYLQTFIKFFLGIR